MCSYSNTIGVWEDRSESALFIGYQANSLKGVGQRRDVGPAFPRWAQDYHGQSARRRSESPAMQFHPPHTAHFLTFLMGGAPCKRNWLVYGSAYPARQGDDRERNHPARR